jgi:hypothetical protein
MPATFVDGEPWVWQGVPPPAPAPVTFTTADLTSPTRVQVTASNGQAAMFTAGAKTVAITGGQTRSFTEIKRVGPQHKDTFTRTRTSRWGMSPFYGSWSAPIGGVDTDYTCDGSTARVLVNTTNTARYTTLRDDDLRDYDVRCKVTTTTMPAGAANSASLIGGYVDTSNHWRFRLTFNTTGTVQLAVDRVLTGTTTTPGANTQVGTGYAANQWWWIRGQSIAGTVQAKAWLDGTSEPAGWTHTISDATLPTGRAGIRAFTTTGATNNPTFVWDEFEVTAGVWANPPAVTHNTWVRLLPAPFTTFDTATQAWLRGALADTRPDVLAYAAAFTTGGAAILDPALGAGKQVLGQSLYGPNNTDGTRVEGADFNDYIAVSWTYPGAIVDVNEPTQQYCLDCSGFVRMVYGYWSGLPMVQQDPATYDGLNLPRRAVAIGPSGPGVLIADGGGAAPALTGLQVGDVVTCNLDPTDDDAVATDDHCGIYLGQDTGGNYLCVSSRKTVNGPTFGALGGSSALNGAGTLAVGLRRIRRF